MDGHSGYSIYMFLKEPGELSGRGEGGKVTFELLYDISSCWAS